MAQDFYLKVTLEAGSYEEDKPYQKTVFMQNYKEKSEQVKEQTALFPEIAKTAVGLLVKTSDEYSNDGRNGTGR